MTARAVITRAVPVRAALLVLTGLSIAATAFELAAERHWGDLVQLVPWAALAVLAVAVALVGWGALRLGRALAVVVLGAGAYGVLTHVLENLGAGALDAAWGARWESLPVLQQWWLALTKTVGPAPTLAPGVLAQAALLLLLASTIAAPAPAGGRAHASSTT